jgi:hypothetical protein
VDVSFASTAAVRSGAIKTIVVSFTRVVTAAAVVRAVSASQPA